MGACVSTADRAAKARSDEIDQQIEEDNERLKRECKVLLLGEFLLDFVEAFIFVSFFGAFVRERYPFIRNPPTAFHGPHN
jgi:hypothetical protein